MTTRIRIALRQAKLTNDPKIRKVKNPECREKLLARLGRDVPKVTKENSRVKSEQETKQEQGEGMANATREVRHTVGG